MTRIDFYVLNASKVEDRLMFVCRLVDKAYRKGHQIYIHTDDESTTDHLDSALWHFRADSFIPHRRIDREALPASPVELGHGQDPSEHQDILINLASAPPDFFSRFHRVSEVVVQHPELLKSSRNRFAFYRDRGYPLHTHPIDNR